MKRILPMMALALLATACHKDKKETTPEPATESVLVYVAGDNNLYDFVMDDVTQMMQGSLRLTEDCNLILFVDQKGKQPCFLQVYKGDTIRQETLAECKTSDAETLAMALQWMKTHYEAKSYGLVLWGHADGWILENEVLRVPRRAYGQDTTGGEEWMNIPEMATALEKVCQDTPLRFIFADCCCFQSVESAYELRHCAEYIIGSAAEIPGEGAPYQTVIPALFSQRFDFYEQAANAYYEQVSYGYREPMSVIKTSEMENLAQATRAALTQSLQPLSEGYPDVDRLIYYYDHTLFDMNDFMLRHADADVYAQWKQTFDKAVPFKTMTTVWMANHVSFQDLITQQIFRDFEVTAERYGGVSMFVPQDVNEVSYSYRNLVERQNKTISRMQWYQAAGLGQLGW